MTGLILHHLIAAELFPLHNVTMAAVNYKAIGTAAAVVGIVGLLIGILLGAAGKFLFVPVDEREIAVRELLPGNNCGGCGFPGCDGLAKAIANGEAPAGQCPVAPAEAKAQIAELMGQSLEEGVRQTAFVKCSGTCDKAEYKYNYYGLQDCRKLALIPGHGQKQCESGCMGYGSCMKECQFDAIRIVNGVAVVDKERCVACGKCVSVCPNHLIELVPYDARCLVGCSSKEKGRAVKDACAAGCLGCGLCARFCESGAITMENNLPRIDFEKCTGCGVCAEKCVQKVIVRRSLEE